MSCLGLSDGLDCFSQTHDLTSAILYYPRGAYLSAVSNLTLKRVAFLFTHPQLTWFYCPWDINTCDTEDNVCLMYI